MLLLIAVSCSMDVMVTWSQQHMEIATFLCAYFHPFVEHNLCFRHWSSMPIMYEPIDSFMNLKF